MDKKGPIRTGGVQMMQNQINPKDYFQTGMESDAEVSMHESHLVDTAYNMRTDRNAIH